MKIRIISLFLSLLLLSILSFESISNIKIDENSSLKTVEQVLEKRLADKFIDETNLQHTIMITLNLKTNVLHEFQKIIYTFKSINSLFRPPINT